MARKEALEVALGPCTFRKRLSHAQRKSFLAGGDQGAAVYPTPEALLSSADQGAEVERQF